ncbi:conserved protein, unknown function [Hepatocystis sp. ex Piliocolobus tephrosceles]|nr:conserved protein, unknown function [Hepatocystis sp. ex Piliocolobus tephrosceles]
MEALLCSLFYIFFCTFFFQAILNETFITAVSVNNKTSNLLIKNGSSEDIFYTMENVYYVPTHKNKLNNNYTFTRDESNMYYDNISDNNNYGNKKKKENLNMMVDQNEINTINSLNKLNSTDTFEKLRSSYYNSNDFNEKNNLYEHIKQILSIALNIPLNEINLHDINMLLKKWKQINKQKNYLHGEPDDNQTDEHEQFLKVIKNHAPSTNSDFGTDHVKSRPDKLNTPTENLTEEDEKNNKNSFIDNKYLFELII